MNASQFLENLGKLKIEDLDTIKGLGPILAANLVDFTNSTRFNDLKNKFSDLENNSISIEINSTKTQIVDGALSGQTICITGTFEKSREEIKAYLSSLGANMTDGVTKKTTILLVGGDPGSKVEKARSLGVEIIESLDELKLKFNL